MFFFPPILNEYFHAVSLLVAIIFRGVLFYFILGKRLSNGLFNTPITEKQYEERQIGSKAFFEYIIMVLVQHDSWKQKLFFRGLFVFSTHFVYEISFCFSFFD